MVSYIAPGRFRCVLRMALLLTVHSASAYRLCDGVGTIAAARLRAGMKTGPESNLRMSRLRGGKDAESEDATETALAHKKKGTEHWIEKRYDLAEEEYKAAFEMFPKNPSTAPERVNCLNNRAACLTKMSKYKEAVKCCTDAIAIDPPNKKARLRRAAALEGLKMYTQAAADMVLLLTEDNNVKEAKDCVLRCLQHSSTLREDVVKEISEIVAQLHGNDKNRFSAAHTMCEGVFVGLLGQPATPQPPSSEGPPPPPMTDIAQDSAPDVAPSPPAQVSPSPAASDPRAADPVAGAPAAGATQTATTQTQVSSPAEQQAQGGGSMSMRDRFSQQLRKAAGTAQEQMAGLESDVKELRGRVEVLEERTEALTEEALLAKKEWQAVRQLAKMSHSAVDYAELGMMLMVRLDGVKTGDELRPRRKALVGEIQGLIDKCEAMKGTLRRFEELFKVPVPVQELALNASKTALFAVAKRWKGLAAVGLGVVGWKWVVAKGGVDMALVVAMDGAMTVVDLGVDTAMAWRRRWFPTTEEFEMRRRLGPEEWEKRFEEESARLRKKREMQRLRRRMQFEKEKEKEDREREQAQERERERAQRAAEQAQRDAQLQGGGAGGVAAEGAGASPSAAGENPVARFVQWYKNLL